MCLFCCDLNWSDLKMQCICDAFVLCYMKDYECLYDSNIDLGVKLICSYVPSRIDLGNESASSYDTSK